MRLSTIVLPILCIVNAPFSAQAMADVDLVADELGQITGTDRAVVREQLRTSLGTDDAVCAAGAIACQEQLRAQVRTCHRIAEAHGRLHGVDDAVALAAAVITLARAGEDTVAAGELVRAQLEHEWQIQQVSDVADAVRSMPPRWQQQTTTVIAACATVGMCTPETTAVTVRVMRAAARRADLDPRRVARDVRAVVGARAGQRGAGDTALQHELHKRLHLSGEGGTESTVDRGEQCRNRYRYQMDGEGRRGGHFGGNASSGEGLGATRGAKPGPRRGDR